MDEIKKEHHEVHHAAEHSTTAHHAEHHEIHHPHINIGKKRVNWSRVFLVLAIIAVLIGAYFLVTSLAVKAAVADASSIKLDYSIEADGKVIAENSSSFKPGQVGATWGLASSKLDDAINKLKKGDKLTLTLSPEDAFGAYNESYISVVNRTEILKREFEINRTFEQPLEAFNQTFNAEPEIGKSYSTAGAPWNFTVKEINDGNITVSQDATEGSYIPVNAMLSANVTKVTSDKITMIYTALEQVTNISSGELNVTMDDENIYFKLTPEKGSQIVMGYFPATVLDFNDTDIVLDYNAPYAGKNITVTIKVDDVTPKKKAASSSSTAIKTVAGAPTLQVFVMSYCPYGTQMEKGVIPAMKLLNGKANFEIRFVSYTMHGAKEDEENSRQICLREEQPDKFWNYLECFLDAGDAAGCITSTGVDSAKLSTCMTNNAQGYLDADKALNTQYGVQGSPTTILNDKEVQIYPRSPEDVKKAVCAAFDTAPAECSETLDSTNPSPGFGFAASASSGSGGCASA